MNRYDFIMIIQGDEIVVQADNAPLPSFHIRDFIKNIKLRDIGFHRIGVFFDFDRV